MTNRIDLRGSMSMSEQIGATADCGDVVEREVVPFPERHLAQVESENMEDDGLRFFRSRKLAEMCVADTVKGGKRARAIRIPAEGEPSAVEALRACVAILKSNPPNKWHPAKRDAIALAEAVPGVTFA